MFLLAFDVARSKTQDCLSPGKKQHHSRPALDPPFLTKDLLGPDFYPYKTRRRQFRQKNDAQPSGVTYTFSEGTFFFGQDILGCTIWRVRKGNFMNLEKCIGIIARKKNISISAISGLLSEPLETCITAFQKVKIQDPKKGYAVKVQTGLLFQKQ